jgi:hypothetical protein
MSTAHAAPAPVRRRLAWALALAALAVMVAWTIDLGSGGAQGKKLALTPDLAWVPPDAPLFVQIRAADVWENAQVKVLRRRLHQRDMERFQRDVEEELLVPLSELEKVTIVFTSFASLFGGDFEDAPRPPIREKAFPDPPPEVKPIEKSPPPPSRRQRVEKPVALEQPGGFDKKPPPEFQIEERRHGPDLWIVTAKKAAALDRIRDQLKQFGDEQKYKGKVYHATKRGEAVYLLNDRTYVRGSIRAIKQGIEQKARADAGPLAPALEKALAKHHLVVGAQLNNETARGLQRVFSRNRGMGLRRTLAPLLAARSGVLWADAGKETRADVEFHFPDATKARAGLGAAQDIITLLRVLGISQGIEWMEENLDTGRVEDEEREFFLMKLLERCETALRELKSEQRGTVAHLSAVADTNLEILDAKIAELLKAREGDEQMQQMRMRRRSMNNLRQIAIALHNVHDAHKRLPPPAILSKDGKPLLSWRVAILPYIEEMPLYNDFRRDEAWDSPHNKQLLARMPKIYAPISVKTKEPHSTFYRGFVPAKGNKFTTAWQSIRNPGGAEGANGPFGAWGGRLSAGFPDGTSNTIFVIEAGEAVPWTKPDELVYDENKALPKLGGLFADGTHAVMADGSIIFIPRQYNEQNLRALITANDGIFVDIDRLRRQ